MRLRPILIGLILSFIPMATVVATEGPLSAHPNQAAVVCSQQFGGHPVVTASYTSQNQHEVRLLTDVLGTNQMDHQQKVKPGQTANFRFEFTDVTSIPDGTVRIVALDLVTGQKVDNVQPSYSGVNCPPVETTTVPPSTQPTSTTQAPPTTVVTDNNCAFNPNQPKCQPTTTTQKQQIAPPAPCQPGEVLVNGQCQLPNTGSMAEKLAAGGLSALVLGLILFLLSKYWEQVMMAVRWFLGQVQNLRAFEANSR